MLKIAQVAQRQLLEDDMPEENDPFETMILRYRDLVTQRGGTIDHHRQKISDHGHVWWGWWSKAGEAPPIRALTEVLTHGPALVFLFDSGTGAVFAAACDDIKMSSKPIPSPDSDKTPAYYANQEYFVWFRFTKIEARSDGIDALRKFSYVRRDEFFEDRRSRYERFYKKQICSVEELRLQDRTMWFVRPFTHQTDATNEILLVSSSTVRPSNFPDRLEHSKHFALLWLSDIHLTKGSQHGFALEEDGTEWSLGSCVEKTLERNEAREVAGILVTGDLTWKADAAEFDLVQKFLGRIARSPSALENYRVVLVPGNHDIAFTNDPSKKGSRVKVAAEPARRNFCEFYNRLFYLHPNAFCSSGRRFLLGGCVPVDVVGLNSSLLQQKAKHFQGQGFVGEGQLEDAAAQMGWRDQERDKRAFRIAMIHHHVLPVTFREEPMEGLGYSVTLDAEAVVRWAVRFRVDLILHGHMHECFFARVVRPVDGGSEEHTVHIAGLGSSGVASDHRPAATPNYIGVLQFTRRKLLVRMLPVVDKNGKTEGRSHEYAIDF